MKQKNVKFTFPRQGHIFVTHLFVKFKSVFIDHLSFLSQCRFVTSNLTITWAVVVASSNRGTMFVFRYQQFL